MTPSTYDISGGNISNSATITTSNIVTNATSSNSVSGITLSNGTTTSTNVLASGYIRNALTPTTYDISGGNISNSGLHITSNIVTNATSSNSVSGITLSNGTTTSTNILSSGYIRNALTPTTYDISGGNISNSGLHITSNIRVSAGTVSVPTYAFTTDPSSGVFLPASSRLGFVTGGIQRVTVNSNGFVGIGIPAPTTNLDLSGSLRVARDIYVAGAAVPTDVALLNWNDSANAAVFASYNTATSSNRAIQFRQYNSGGNVTRMHIDVSGNVGIGTTVPDADLTVRDISSYSTTGRMTDVLSLKTNYKDRPDATSAKYVLRSGVYDEPTAGAEVPQLQFASMTAAGVSNVNMTLTHSNVGIGTTTPSASVRLDVSGLTRVFGDPTVRLSAGNSASSNGVAQFFVESQTDASSAAAPGVRGRLLFGYDPLTTATQWGTGFIQGIVPNTATFPICLQPSGGRVGIGTSNPTNGSLHIDTSLSVTTPAGGQLFPVSGYAGSWAGGTETVSLYTRGAIWAAGARIIVSSDERIKTDIRDISDGDALHVIRTIEPKTYKYVEEEERGSNYVYGFLAQQVSNILPYSVQLKTKSVPDIYCYGDISGSYVRLAKDISYTDISAVVHYVTNDFREIKTVTQFIDSRTLLPETGLDCSGVFVYGREVNDFHVLDKNAIYTVGIAALQELDRQVQALKQRVQDLEDTLNSPA